MSQESQNQQDSSLKPQMSNSSLISQNQPPQQAFISKSKQPALTKVKSNRCIRSPIPPNHKLIKQHGTSNPSHHRQYVLLRDKPTSGSSSPIFSTASYQNINNATSPPLAPTSSIQSTASLPQNKPKPFLKKQPSSKYVFSVDDDEDEIEEDLNREYLEGFNDALRQRFKLPVQSPSQTPDNISRASNTEGKKKELELEISNDLISVAKELDNLKELESDTIHKNSNKFNPNCTEEEIDTSSHTIGNDSINYGNSENNNNINNDNNKNNNISSNRNNYDIIDEEADDNGVSDDDNNNNDNASISSNESFTLRERQVAINETHPFGIRIWKPAIYKKNRSVEREAENDIHCTPGAERKIGLGLLVCNFIWTCTFGLILLILCLLVGSIIAIFAAGFNPKVNDSLKYAKLYFSLGKYLWRPFGKIVLLESDTNYLNEDAHVGSSIDEFERWRTQNQGRLFFSAPNALRRSPDENTHLQADTEAQNYSSVTSDATVDDDDDNDIFFKKRMFGRGQWNLGRVIFFIFFYLILQPISIVIALLMWLSVFCIPMAKVMVILCSHLRKHPLALSFENEMDYYKKHLNNSNQSKESFLILTYRSFGLHYYKYTVDGTNIFFINMNFLVLFTIFDFYLLKESLSVVNLLTNSSFIFILCLVSIIPLAYFIGQAVASISAQTSMGVGAVINAFFSTVVEIYLYCIALDQSKAKLVEGSVIGSILGAVLLLPGGSMCAGAIRRKTQRYNPASAGVSSTLLLYAILVMLSPTILYQIYGEYEVRCNTCDISTTEDCRKCHYYQPSIVVDQLYIKYLKPFTVACAIALFLAYFIGLIFTLKTHAALIWSTPVTTSVKEKKSELPLASPQVAGETQSVASFSLNDQSSAKKPSKPQQITTTTTTTTVAVKEEAPAEGGHDAPNWSRFKSTTILLLATLMYAVIAEILVNVVDDVLSEFPINPKFLGLTVFALVPNTTEFVNAFSFAMHGNVALSMEIGSAYALQVCLLQIPILVMYSVWNFSQNFDVENGGLPTVSSVLGFAKTVSTDLGNVSQIGVENMFSLIFPHWDFIASLLSVYMFTYIYTEGKSNYFKGSILILLYIVLVIGFYFAIEINAAKATGFNEVISVGGKVWGKV